MIVAIKVKVRTVVGCGKKSLNVPDFVLRLLIGSEKEKGKV